MSRRRIERSIWSNGHRRRSPRISALDQQLTSSSRPTPFNKKAIPLPTQTQQRCKRSSTAKRKRQDPGTIDHLNHKEHSTSSDQTVVTKAKEKETLDSHVTSTGHSVKSNVALIPEKSILELALDVLQRRDTYEIFAEPVDPLEVEEYYEIVKEPMDFGTMRAKLHEGMYQTLEQFEHDAFLIPRNAMHFNSTATVYFRQARAIDDLAKKVFHLLKTDPNNFELEFSGTRRRSSRRLQGEGKGLKFYPSSRLAKNATSSCTTSVVSSREAQYFGKGPSDFRKSIKGNPGSSSKGSCTRIRDSEIFIGAKDGRRYDFVNVDWRHTYKQQMSAHWDNDIIVSAMSGGPKLLARVNQQDISYRESLMLFAKDLGPLAQMVIKRKLQAWYKDASYCQGQGQAATTQVPPPFSNLQKTTLHALIDLNNVDDGNKSYTTSTSNKEEESTSNECDTRKIYGFVGDGHRVFENKPHPGFYSSTNGVEELKNSSVIRTNDNAGGTQTMMAAAKTDSGKIENQGLQVILASEYSQSNKFGTMLRNNNHGLSSSVRQNNCFFMQGTGSTSKPTAIAAAIKGVAPKIGMTTSVTMASSVEPNQQCTPVLVSPPFTFNLSFLKSQLNQMEHSGQ